MSTLHGIGSRGGMSEAVTAQQRAAVFEDARRRMEKLSIQDKADLFDLALGAWSEGPVVLTDPARMSSIVQTAMDIIYQRPIDASSRDLDLPAEESAGDPKRPAGLQNWVDWMRRRIVDLRHERRWTQEQLAQRSGLPQSHISRIERGRLSPSRRTVEKLAAAFGVPVEGLDPGEP